MTKRIATLLATLFVFAHMSPATSFSQDPILAFGVAEDAAVNGTGGVMFLAAR